MLRRAGWAGVQVQKQGPAGVTAAVQTGYWPVAVKAVNFPALTQWPPRLALDHLRYKQ